MVQCSVPFLTCVSCRLPFEVTLARVETAKFCSYTCRSNRRPPRPCEICGAIFKPRIRQSRFCSYVCAAVAKTVPHEALRCLACKESFSASPCAKRKYCSLDCAYKDRQRLALEEFWSHVDRRGPNDCWPWIAALDKKGYGKVGIRSLDQCGRGAHQVAYVITHNMDPIPEGINVCHSCDNPPCCNPAHLFLGTQKDNLKDCAVKMRTARGSANGQAKLTEDNIRQIFILKDRGASSKRLAEMFSITRGSITRILAGGRWAHI